MKVLHVLKELQAQSSGVARHVEGLGLALRAHGVDCRAFVPAAAPVAASLPATRGDMRALERAIQEADLVHVHGARTRIAGIAGLLALHRRRKLVYTPHCYYDGGAPLLRAAKWVWDWSVERPLLRHADAVLLLDHSWRDYLGRRAMRVGHAIVFPNCVTGAAVAARRPAVATRLAGAPALLSISRIDRIKALDEAIAALAQPGLETAVLHLVGDGPDLPRLQASAQRLGVAARVRFHGWKSDAEAGAMLAGADLFLLPSHREGMPTSLLESFLARVPVVCSDIPGCRAIAEPAGWRGLFPVGDVPALAAAIRTWAGSVVPDATVAAIENNFTWERRAGEVASLYRRVIAGTETG